MGLRASAQGVPGGCPSCHERLKRSPTQKFKLFYDVVSLVASAQGSLIVGIQADNRIVRQLLKTDLSVSDLLAFDHIEPK